MGKVVKVSGPLVVATGMADANMSDVVPCTFSMIFSRGRWMPS